MKIILLILLLPFSVSSQNLEGVWELKWGISVDSAINSIKKKKGYTPEIIKTDTTTTLLFKNAQWGFQTSNLTRLEFYKDKLYSAYGFFTPANPEDYLDVYNSIKRSISQKYFLPTEEKEEYKPPFKDSDSNKMKVYAILKGYATIVCSWTFTTEPKDKNVGFIGLTITKDIGIILLYQDGNLSEIINKQATNQALKDF